MGELFFPFKSSPYHLSILTYVSWGNS